MTDRRSATIELEGKRYQVREPNPTRAYRAGLWCGKLLGEVLAKILAGRLEDKEPPVCPKCRATGAKNIGAEWLCMARGDEGVCGRVWDQRVKKGPDGRPVRVSLEYALNDDRWGALLGSEARRALDALDVDDAEQFMLEVLPGYVDIWIGEAWVTINNASELDFHMPDGGTITQLVRLAMTCWILPSFVGGLATVPASSAAKTHGDLPDAPPPPSGRTQGPPRTSTTA